MSRVATLLLGTLAMALAFGASRAAPLEAYGRLPPIEAAAISSDGKMYALVVTDGDSRTVSVRLTADDKLILNLHAGETKVRGVNWAGPYNLLVTTSVAGKPTSFVGPDAEYFQIINVNLKTRTQMNLLGAADLKMAVSQAQVRIVNGRTYAFVEGVRFVNGAGRLALYRVDLADGDTSVVVVGERNAARWIVGPNGGPVAELVYDSQTSRWTLMVQSAGQWRDAASQVSPVGYEGVIALGRDGRSVVATTEVDGKRVLREMAPDGDDWGPPLDIGAGDDLIADPLDGRLIGHHALIGDADVYTFFSPPDQATWDWTRSQFPGAAVALYGLTADHRALIVRTDSPTDGPRFAIVDAGAHATRVIQAANLLTPADVAPVQPVAFKAADGLPLSGYLTLPRGRDPKALPLIVFPHGGPAARDEPGFDWWAQGMASRGYAVLQVNYRGSDGFGRPFLEAGFGQWGRKMQTDLSDGVRYLAAQGTIDPKRVCIVGGSYGGYAALAGVTLDPGVYRCAVSVGGISDVARMLAGSRETGGLSLQRYWDRFMGVSAPKDPRVEEISPIDHLDSVAAPILLIHGADDTVVLIEQSRVMADALRKAGKPVELVTLKGEDHWLSRGETRIQMLKAAMDFVEKNNPP